MLLSKICTLSFPNLAKRREIGGAGSTLRWRRRTISAPGMKRQLFERSLIRCNRVPWWRCWLAPDINYILEELTMALSPLAGKPAPQELLIDPAQLERDYYRRQPDLSDPNQKVSFGTSGHRGTSLNGSFTESHILAIAQAI